MFTGAQGSWLPLSPAAKGALGTRSTLVRSDPKTQHPTALKGPVLSASYMSCSLTYTSRDQTPEAKAEGHQDMCALWPQEDNCVAGMVRFLLGPRVGIPGDASVKACPMLPPLVLLNDWVLPVHRIAILLFKSHCKSPGRGTEVKVGSQTERQARHHPLTLPRKRGEEVGRYRPRASGRGAHRTSRSCFSLRNSTQRPCEGRCWGKMGREGLSFSPSGQCQDPVSSGMTLWCL